MVGGEEAPRKERATGGGNPEWEESRPALAGCNNQPQTKGAPLQWQREGR